MSFEILVTLLVLALAFDFMNGFHDSANSIATIVSTRVLRPHWAVFWAAFFNFIAYVFIPLKVAATIGKGIVDPNIVDQYVIFGALMGAILWNIITWYYGIPSSSSHALVGGMAGAAIAKGGVDTLIAAGFNKTAIAIILSPTLGFLLGVTLMIGASWLFFRTSQRRVDKWFRRFQFISASYYSLMHGANDAQKTMGIIMLLLIAYGAASPDFKVEDIPLWVVLSCQGAIALGTLFGGWRIVKTMGQKITHLKPIGGFCAETGAASTLLIASSMGVPVSTTHTITGAIVGVGSAQKFNAVRWGVAGNIVWAWILTIPASAFIAAVSWYVGQQLF